MKTLIVTADDFGLSLPVNEAVELAKAFGSDNSSKFINGVLGTAFRTLVEGSEATPDADAKV